MKYVWMLYPFIWCFKVCLFYTTIKILNNCKFMQCKSFFYINNIFNLINEHLKVKVCGVFSLFDCKGWNQHGKERALYFWSGLTLELNWLFLKGSFVRGLKFWGPFWQRSSQSISWAMARSDGKEILAIATVLFCKIRYEQRSMERSSLCM